MSNEVIDPAVLRKVSLRLLPMLMLLYFFAYLDRVNVGFAALTMNADLGLSSAAYGLGAGAFFIGYFFFEVPSNLALTKYGARVWITRIIVTWGLIAGCMSMVQGPVSFYILRFFLGVAEAGFFPGMIYFLGIWFPRAHRARIVAAVYVAAPVSFVVGSPLSTLMLEHGHGFLGLDGWRFMFAAQGALTVLAGIAGYLVLVDRPSKARWLTKAEAQSIESVIATEDAEVSATHGAHSLRKAFTPRVFLLAAIYFCVAYGIYNVAFFLPTAIQEFNSSFDLGLSLQQIGLLAAIPYGAAAVSMLLWSRRSDVRRERYLHFSAAIVLGSVALPVAVYADSPLLAMVAIILSTMGVFSTIPVFWQIPATFLTGTAAAAGIGVINSIGNLAGFVAPYSSGFLKDITGSLHAGMLIASGMMLLAAVLALVARVSIDRGGRGPASSTVAAASEPLDA